MRRRIVKTAGELIEKAHESQDDLEAQKIVHAFGLGSAIHYAAVVDNAGKALAHSDPAYIGQRWIPASSGAGFLWRLRLQNNTHSWGTLVIEGSRSLRNAELLMEGVLISILIMLTTTGIWRRERFWELIQKNQQHEITNRVLEWEQEKARQNKQIHSTLDQMAELHQQIDHLLNVMDKPMILLDSRQRLTAANHTATDMFQLEGSIGRSWQDVARMESFGPLLKTSIDKPGLMVSVDDLPVSMETWLSPENKLIGTLIFGEK